MFQASCAGWFTGEILIILITENYAITYSQQLLLTLLSHCWLTQGD